VQFTQRSSLFWKIYYKNRYGISTKTIYGWLTKDSGEDVISILKHNKLKRENEELKRIIGKLTLDMSWGKKG